MDSFRIKYGNCTEVSAIHLSDSCGTPITSLKPLLGIKIIKELVFEGVDELTNLDGLDSVRYIGDLRYENYNINTDGINNVDTIEYLSHDYSIYSDSDLSMYKNIKWIKGLYL